MTEIEANFEDSAMNENGGKIIHEVAQDEFNRFAAAWDLDTDIDYMNQDDADSFEQQKRKIVRQIMDGRAIVNDEGNIEYTLFEPIGTLAEVTFKRPHGRGFTAMDRAKDGKSITKFINMVGDAIGQPPSIINKMDGIDVKFCQAVYMLFLGS